MGLAEECRIGLYEKALPDNLDWKEKLRTAKDCGYDYLELSIDESQERMQRLDWSGEEIAKIRGIQEREKIFFESICFSAQRKYPLGSRIWETQAKEILRKCITFAKKMGIGIIQVQGYDCYYDEESDASTYARFYRNIREATMFAAANDVVLAVETMESEFMNTVEKVMHGISYVNSPYLQIYPDVGNLFNAQKDVVTDLRQGRGHIVAAHLKETIPGHFRKIPYGKGQVDFPAAIAELYQLGVRRYVAEFWYDPENYWKKELLDNKKFIDGEFCKAEMLIYEELCVGTG